MEAVPKRPANTWALCLQAQLRLVNIFLTVSLACLINWSLWMRSETYGKGQLFSFITYVGNSQSRSTLSLKSSLKDPHRRCQDSWTFIFHPPKQCLSESLLKFRRTFLGVWGKNGRKLRSGRRWKGSHTRRICPEARRARLGFKCVLTRTRLPALQLPQAPNTEPHTWLWFRTFCLPSCKCEQKLPVWSPVLRVLWGVFP